MLEIAEGAAENLMVLSAVFAAGFLLGCGAGRFLRQPKKEQEKKVKAWLLWAVTSAEQEMQGAPGRLKLRRVYDMFVQRFPAMALAVSFDTFCEWVDDALQEGVELLTDADAESADSTAEKGKESDME